MEHGAGIFVWNCIFGFTHAMSTGLLIDSVEWVGLRKYLAEQVNWMPGIPLFQTVCAISVVQINVTNCIGISNI